MPSIILDTGVLAPPDYHSASVDVVEHYIENLLSWYELNKNNSWVTIYRSDGAFDILMDDELPQLLDRLQALLRKVKLESYSANDIYNHYMRNVFSLPSFEDAFRISDVLTENDPVTDPDILGMHLDTNLKSDLARCVVLLAFLRSQCQKPMSDHILALRHVPNKKISVHACIHDFDHARDDIDRLTFLVTFAGDVLACDDFQGFIKCLDEASILYEAQNSVDVKTAIRIAVYKARLEDGKDPDWNEELHFRLGDNFLQSFQKCHSIPSLAANLLKAVVYTIEDNHHIGEPHKLRSGSGGNAPERIRKHDQAKAWRRDIAGRDHHLHYWICAGGIKELADVTCSHDDFDITE